MAGMPWVKLYVDFLDDHKIGMLDPPVQLFFVKLLLLVGDCDAEGYLVNGETPIEPEHIAWRLRMPKSDVDSALACLLAVDLIEYDDEIIIVPAFQKRQGRSQSVKREQWRQRKAKQRGQEGDEAECPVGVTRDAKESHAPRGEERREEESREEKEEPTPTRRTRSAGYLPAITVYQEEASRLPPESWRNVIAEAVGLDQTALDRWRRVVHGWIGQGWKPGNVQGMIDFFGRNEIPGENRPTGPPGNGRGADTSNATIRAVEQLEAEEYANNSR